MEQPADLPASRPENFQSVDVPVVEESSPDTAVVGSEEGKNSGSGRRGFWWLIVIILLATAGGLGYFRGPVTEWFVSQGFIEPDPQITLLTQRLALVEQEMGKVRGQLAVTTKLTADVDQQRQRVEALSAKQVVVNQQITKIEARLARQLADWRPIEVRHLLFLADQRLHLADDMDGALQALRSADQILQAIDERRWLPLREKIAAAVSSLQAVSRVDVDGLRLRLRELAHQVDRLSGFAQLTIEPATSPTGTAEPQINNDAGVSDNGWKQRFVQAWKQITTQLAGLINVQRTGQVLPTLTNEQLQALKFHLTAELLLVEVNLLQRDPDYNLRLLVIEQMVGRYFEPASQPAAAILEELRELRAVEMVVDLPDISSPLVWLDQELADRPLP